MVLICKDCNDRAGYTIDAAASDVERGLAFLAGLAPGPVRIRVGDHAVDAVMEHNPQQSGGQFTVMRQAPQAIESFQAAVKNLAPTEGTLHVSYSIPDPNEARARTSWLKSAYLVMFAFYGYRYIFHEALERVRLQIREPAARHLQTFSVRLPGLIPYTTRRAFRVNVPELPPCWAIQMGPNIVFMPREPSDRVYDRLAELRETAASLEIKTTEWFWPTRPPDAQSEERTT